MESPETSEAVGSALSSLGMDYGGKIYDLAIYSSSMLDRLLRPVEGEYQRVIVAQRGSDTLDTNIIRAILAALGHTKTASRFRMPFQVVAAADPLAGQAVSSTLKSAVSVTPAKLIPKLTGNKIPLKVKKRTVAAVQAPKPPQVAAVSPVGQLTPGSQNPGGPPVAFG